MRRIRAAAALGVVLAASAVACLSGCSIKGAADPRQTPPPVQGLSTTPTSLSMGPTDTGAVNAIEPGYTGSFTAQSSDTTVASVTTNGPAQFLVHGVNVGLCNVTVSDSNGHQAIVKVSIQTVVIGGQ